MFCYAKNLIHSLSSPTISKLCSLGIHHPYSLQLLTCCTVTSLHTALSHQHFRVPYGTKCYETCIYAALYRPEISQKVQWWQRKHFILSILEQWCLYLY